MRGKRRRLNEKEIKRKRGKQWKAGGNIGQAQKLDKEREKSCHLLCMRRKKGGK